MSAVRQWAFAVCAAMVACGLAGMILPKSSMEKMFRVVVSIFFLCCLLSPLALSVPDLLGELDLSLDAGAAERAERLSETASEQAVRLVERNLQNLIAENLAETGINVDALAINIVTNGQNDSGEIALESVTVRLSAPPEELEEGREEMEARLRELVGAEVVVEFA